MKDVRKDPRGLYALIGVHPSDSPEVIAAAFRRKVRILHPDVASTGNAAAFIELKTAYDVLADPISRAEYDLSGPRLLLEELEPGDAVPGDPQPMSHPGMRWPRMSDLPRVVWVGFGLIIATSLAQAVIGFSPPTPSTAPATIPPNAPGVPLVVSSRTQLSPPPTTTVAAAVRAVPAAPPITVPVVEDRSSRDMVQPVVQLVAAPDHTPARDRPAPTLGDGRETAASSIRTPAPVETKTPPAPKTDARIVEEPAPADPPRPRQVALAPLPAAKTTTPPIVPSEAQAMSVSLLSRGYALLAAGDVASARLMFEHAARSGLAAAAIAAGMTHDPRILAEFGARGMVADTQAAAQWYRRAAALGDDRAGPLLTDLGTGE